MSCSRSFISLGTYRESFAHDFEKAFDRHSAQWISREIRKRTASQGRAYILDSGQHMDEPITERRRHLEYLDDIIGNPLRDPRLQRTAVACTARPVASSIICWTPTRLRMEKRASGSTSTSTSRSL